MHCSPWKNDCLPEKKQVKIERETWTTMMDDVLVDAFFHQHNIGNKVNRSFTSKAYECIVKELQANFDRVFDKEKVKNRWKTLKKRFFKCYSVFNYDLSGFSWDPTTKLWCAEPQVWQKLIETKPEAEEWMRKPIANYDKMMIMCGNDRATGLHAENAREFRNKRSFTGETDSFDTIDGIDQMFSQNDVTLESFQEMGDDNAVTSPEMQVVYNREIQEVKAKRARRSKYENELEGIKEALRDIAQALREGNAIYERVKQRLPISEAEIWKLLEDLKIEKCLFNRAYLYLLDNPNKIKGILGCPEDKRMGLLHEMLFGSFGPPRY